MSIMGIRFPTEAANADVMGDDSTAEVPQSRVPPGAGNRPDQRPAPRDAAREPNATAGDTAGPRSPDKPGNSD